METKVKIMEVLTELQPSLCGDFGLDPEEEWELILGIAEQNGQRITLADRPGIARRVAGATLEGAPPPKGPDQFEKHRWGWPEDWFKIKGGVVEEVAGARPWESGPIAVE